LNSQLSGPSGTNIPAVNCIDSPYSSGYGLGGSEFEDVGDDDNSMDLDLDMQRFPLTQVPLSRSGMVSTPGLFGGNPRSGIGLWSQSLSLMPSRSVVRRSYLIFWSHYELPCTCFKSVQSSISSQQSSPHVSAFPDILTQHPRVQTPEHSVPASPFNAPATRQIAKLRHQYKQMSRMYQELQTEHLILFGKYEELQ